MGRLRSVKHYFFVDQGDFLVHFMDTARDELAKRPSAMSMEKLQSLLELALRTSVAASDPYHEDLTCNIERSNLLTQLQNISQNGAGPAHYNSQRTDSTDASSLQGMASGSITGLETFTLDYKVRQEVFSKSCYSSIKILE
jgi:gamma-tubulin complex component 2